MVKKRADQILVERGLAETRSRAQAYIMAGHVYAGEQKIIKSGQQIKEDTVLEVRGKEHPWVSRGGLKLLKGLQEFKIDISGMTVIDVGHGQLAWKIRNDERVIVLEKTNARYLNIQQIPIPVDLIVCDTSFIGLQTVLPAPMSLAGKGCILVALIKPQFEVGKGKVGKGGVVREPELHKEVCNKIKNWITEDMVDWEVIGLTQSPIKGPEGNIEFLIGAKYDG